MTLDDSRYLVLLAVGLVAAGCGSTGHRTSSGTESSTPTGGSIPTHIYRIPSSAMEPTLHCARPTPGCRARHDDGIVVRLSGAKGLERGGIIVFRTPPAAATECGEGGIFVKRGIGLGGETVHEDKNGFIDIDGKQLSEPYISTASRLADIEHFGATWHVPRGDYFTLGDNRANSCNSRVWGSGPAGNVIGPVTKILRGRATVQPVT